MELFPTKKKIGGIKPFPVKIQPVAQPIEPEKVGVWSAIKGGISDLIRPTVEKVLPTYTEPTKHAYQKTEEFVSTLTEPTPLAQKIASGLSMLTADVGVLFTPITAIFTEAEKIPVLKPAVEVITAPFTIGAITGGFIADRFVDALPISEENKDILRPAFEEVGETAGMIWLGGKTMQIIKDGKKITTKKVETLKKEMPEKVKTAEIPAPKAPEIARVAPEVAKPTIEPFPTKEVVETKITEPIVQEVAPTPIEPITGAKPSKIALSIEAKAIETGLTKGFKDLAGFDPIKIKEQAQMMADIMKTDIEMAKRIATGKESLPKELNPVTAIKAMEDYAMKTRDGKLAQEIASSPLVAETSVAAQTLRLAAERTPDSAVAKIREIAKEREIAVEKKLKGKKSSAVKAELTKGLKEKIKQKKPTKYDWNNFIDSIKC